MCHLEIYRNTECANSLFLRLTNEFLVDSCAHVINFWYLLPSSELTMEISFLRKVVIFCCFEAICHENTSENELKLPLQLLEYNSSTPFTAKGWPLLPLDLMLFFILNKYSPTFVLCYIATSFLMIAWHKEERLGL